MKEKFLAMTLAAALAASLTGCMLQADAQDLMEDVKPNAVTPLSAEDLSAGGATLTDFAVRLLQASEEKDKNTLVSPLSVLYALSMTANGAKGETLHQMEQTLGSDTQTLNEYLYSYRNALPHGKNYKLHLANSIWFTKDERFTVNQQFLQTNGDYYGADIYRAAFDDKTCKEINGWVKKHTDGMIPEILDEIPKAAVMYLVNALAFEAEWDAIYKEDQIYSDQFTLADGTTRNVKMMSSTVPKYLEDENATGFIKYYAGGEYAFAALLPDEDLSLSDYVADLDGAALHDLLRNAEDISVLTRIPKFETEYSTDLAMVLAFDSEQADVSGLGSSSAGNIYISRVLHKTFISVAEKGTKAGAATVVEVKDSSAGPLVEKTVYLDRPFVYMLIDCNTMSPFFIGTMYDVQQ